MVKKRKVPLRKCIVTQEMLPKEDLIRIVRNKEGDIFVDVSGKQNGRGAYLSKDINVIEKAQKTHILNQQFKTKVCDTIYDDLRQAVDGTQL